MIKCKYHKGYETNNKYFCKGESTPCDNQIKTDNKNTWVHEGRFSLYDNTSAKVFWVLMRNLTVEDTGTYQCAVDIKAWTDTYTEVKVKVIAGVDPVTPAVKSSTAHLSSSPASTVQTEHSDSTRALPGLAVFSSLGAGLVLITFVVITSIYCTIKRRGPGTVRQSREINEDYINITTIHAFQQRENNQSKSVYQNFSQIFESGHRE